MSMMDRFESKRLPPINGKLLVDIKTLTPKSGFLARERVGKNQAVRDSNLGLTTREPASRRIGYQDPHYLTNKSNFCVNK
jgi:hypothetical protein